MSAYRSIVIFYFSGTGNAKQIALWFSERAIKKHLDCQIFDISKTDIDKIKIIGSDALIVIISPVHGFNYPKITLNFIKHFPKGGNNIVLMNTRAGMKIGRFVTPGLTGIAFLLSSVILKSRGYRIVGQIPFDMPSNWISIHPALHENTVKFLHEKNYYRVIKHFNRIVSGKTDFHAYRELVQDILISPVSIAYYLAGKYLFAKSFYASVHCNNCGLCVKQCPVNAIKTINNRPYWTHKCESCMKCMNSCPKKAIETAHGLMVTTSILSSVALTILLNNILIIDLQSGIVRFLIQSFIFFALLWILYKFQHLLLRNKRLGKLISYTSLTHYKFWGRYKSIPDYKWKK
ncbi:EFR1 family ferrodoxin [Saccharicrinis sp. FJH54]|uniref:EFR1 family ferrodoxin n=1 Tax=Saccharicrinis sp. FJH54 TaxID=3344665 RepID=UPI0035D4AD8F